MYTYVRGTCKNIHMNVYVYADSQQTVCALVAAVLQQHIYLLRLYYRRAHFTAALLSAVLQQYIY